MVFWSHFNLPTGNGCPIDGGTEENSAVAVRELFKVGCEIKNPLLVLFSTHVAISLVRPLSANEQAVFDIPFFSSVNDPAREVGFIE